MTLPLARRELGAPNSFTGFALPVSNTTFTPNQFFDVCLPYASRGCVRVVAYLIRKTLGWCDEHGNPTESQFRISYSQLEREAGIGHTSVRAALDEAVARGFLSLVAPSRLSVAGQAAKPAQYELRWERTAQYVKHPDLFTGFFEGEGNRTDIPNQYFDVVVPHEPLSVIQVVGAIIRFSIGFQARRGARRQQAVLSYADLRRYTKIKSGRILVAALRKAEAQHYIVRVDRGFFDPNAGRLSRAATYMLRWVDTPTPESAPASHSEKVTGPAPKSEPAAHSEKSRGIQTKLINNTFKQQGPAPAVPLNNEEGFHLLRVAGFDVRAAVDLSDRYPTERLRRQIDWLPRRKAAVNPMGLLRRAIEEDWSAPPGVGKRSVGCTQPEEAERSVERERRDLLRRQSEELANQFKP